MSPLIPKLWAHFVKGGAYMPSKIPADCVIRRVHAGEADRCNGAWSWFLWSRTDQEAARILYNRGSAHPAREVAYAPYVSVYIRTTDAELCIERAPVLAR